MNPWASSATNNEGSVFGLMRRMVGAEPGPIGKREKRSTRSGN